MELFKLKSDQYPGETIKNFESLAWTESYQDSGDFQLVVENEVAIFDMLPLGTLISHTDTTEVMIVENHEISRNKNKDLKIVVSGRSFETFSENRVSFGSDIQLKDVTTGDAKVTTLTLSAEDVAVSLLQRAFQSGISSVDNAIFNLLVTKDIRVADTAMEYVIKRGSLYKIVLDFLGINDLGIKTIRPNGTQTTMNLVIHDGIDRSNSIIFYAQYEDLDDAKYFWSNKTYKNYAQVTTNIYQRLYKNRDLPTNVSGIDRRILYVEVTDLEETYDPPTNTDIISAVGQIQLDQVRKISLLTAKISNTATPKFKFDYDVGDIVTVFGEFATAQTMRVTEHILTVDKAGIRGYPSLSLV